MGIRNKFPAPCQVRCSSSILITEILQIMKLPPRNDSFLYLKVKQSYRLKTQFIPHIRVKI